MGKYMVRRAVRQSRVLLPVYVTRGPQTQAATAGGPSASVLHLGIDTAHLVVLGFPSSVLGSYFKDILNSYKRAGVPMSELMEGITVTQELPNGLKLNGVLLRAVGMPGGYSSSLWFGDTRVFFSVSNHHPIYIQVGPKTLNEIGLPDRAFVKELLYECGLQLQEWHQVRVKRLDVAADFSLNLGEFEANSITGGWVGRSNVRRLIFGEDGVLETVYVGSEESDLNLRIYDKRREAVKDNDIGYWRAIWTKNGALPEPEYVTRVEWEVHAFDAGFEEITYAYQLTDAAIAELVSYLLGWGRLCVPGSATRRENWRLTSFWRSVRDGLTAWCGSAEPLQRVHVQDFDGVTRSAMAQFLGLFGAVAADVGAVLGYDKPATIHEVFAVFEDVYGVNIFEAVADRANRKFARSRLVPAERRLRASVYGDGAAYKHLSEAASARWDMHQQIRDEWQRVKWRLETFQRSTGYPVRVGGAA